jgi:hypothetical protein
VPKSVTNLHRRLLAMELNAVMVFAGFLSLVGATMLYMIFD